MKTAFSPAQLLQLKLMSQAAKRDKSTDGIDLFVDVADATLDTDSITSSPVLVSPPCLASPMGASPKQVRRGYNTTPIRCRPTQSATAILRKARRALIIPGNGNSAKEVEDKAWYSVLREELEAEGLEAILCGQYHVGNDAPAGSMPDPIEAKRSIWCPFVEQKFLDDPSGTVLIGHSSGAICAMRLLEKHRLFGALLVSAYHTTLGLASEKVSGYFDEPWDWVSIRANAGDGNIAIVNSTHCMSEVPIAEGDYVAASLGVACIRTSGYVNFPIAPIFQSASALIRGAAGAQPQPVRVLAITAGVGQGTFQAWTKALSAGGLVEIVPVDLPASAARLTSLADVARALADDLIASASSKLDRPSVLFGHGLGAWLAYETLLLLHEEHGRLRDTSPVTSTRSIGASRAAPPWYTPGVLVASGIRPPHLAGIDNEADRQTPSLSTLDSDAFWHAFSIRYGLDPALNEVRDLFEPTLRKELGMMETYVPTRHGGRAPPEAKVRMGACMAKGDGNLLPGQLEAWGDCAPLGDDGFEMHVLDASKQPAWATPNRYLLDDPAALQKLLSDQGVLLAYRHGLVSNG